MNIQKILMLSCATGALVGFSGSAAAQDSGGIGEVVITAEKREQSIQDVPVAVTAITSEQRDVIGITTIQDFANLTPGMTRTNGDRLSLRGAGKFTFFLGSDPGVATYSDGFYSQNFSLEAFKTPIFTERTEILRGPQGTLYGRNSMGGSLNVISQRPTDEFTGELRAVVGNYDTTRLEGYISGPLTDSLRYRLLASIEQRRDGFIENIGPAPDESRAQRSFQEAQIDWDVTSNLHVWARYTTSVWDDSNGVEDRFTNLLSSYDHNNFREPGAQVISTQYNYCNVPGAAAPVGVNLGTQECVGFGGAFVNPGTLDPFKNNVEQEGMSQLHDYDAYVVQADYDLGGMNLRYLGGYQTYDFKTEGDTFGTGRTDSYVATNAGFVPGATTTMFPQARTYFRQQAQYFSNELNLSNGDDETVHWILGIYQYHEKFSQNISLTFPNQPELIAANIAFFGEDRGGQYTRADALQSSNSWAGFGQGDWHINDDLTFTLGLRYTHDEKVGSEFVEALYFNPITFAPGFLNGTAFGLVNGVLTFGNLANPTRTRTWDATTGTLGLQWQADEDTLLYGRFSRGYKAGGYQLGTGSSDQFYDPESVDAFEVGFKRDFGSTLRTNAAFFFNTYEDFQINLGGINPTTGRGESRAINLGAETYGAEFEVTWAPIEDMIVALGYSYLHTEVTTACVQPDLLNAATWIDCYYDTGDATGVSPGAQNRGALQLSPSPIAANLLWPDRFLQFQSLQGNALPQAPEHKLSLNVNYTFHTGLGALTLSGTGFWSDTVFTNVFNNPTYLIPERTQADFRALLTDPDGRFTIIGYVKNAFDEVGYNSNGPLNPGTRYLPNSGTARPISENALARGLIWPRTFGVEMQFHF